MSRTHTLGSRTTERRESAAQVSVLETPLNDLRGLQQAMLEYEGRLAGPISQAAPAHLRSAINLAHYIALRSFDLRPLQQRLTDLGLSSLGRSEVDVMANVQRVIEVVQRLAGLPHAAPWKLEPVGTMRGRELLEQHTRTLFGEAPADRNVRMMVTLPSDAAVDDALLDRMIDEGMDIARINCAHDEPGAWLAMAARVRSSAARACRPVRVLMDLGGPKLRTGPIASGPPVFKLKPVRDELGGMVATGRVGLRANGSRLTVTGAGHHLGVDASWLQGLEVRDVIDLVDARGACRQLRVVSCEAAGVLVECSRTAYLTPDTRLKVRRRGATTRATRLGDLPIRPGKITLHRGQTLRMVERGLGHAEMRSSSAISAGPATIACTLPMVLTQIRVGDPIWFDDGRIGGTVTSASASQVDIEITQAREGGESLAGDKGINLPTTPLRLPALTDKDLEDLKIAVRCADLVGLSFAQSPQDVIELRKRLDRLGAGSLGVILKIETQRGFEALPHMLFAAMAGPAAGVMIARGDLAVECGYERLAEVQEEVLWACEAAHMPVVWATQVLDTLARTGRPSRAEITDAAMGERAECVMLNKGPYIVDALRALDDILRRMQTHQSKKRPLLRALTAWAATSRSDTAPVNSADPPARPPLSASSDTAK
jgi:pyruvate kinase